MLLQEQQIYLRRKRSERSTEQTAPELGGEAKPPQADRMSVIKALSHDVTILAFVPLSLVPLEALLCIESVAADA
ncbi:MAG: hypothetical protein ACI33P_00995, partial [Lysinibacillus sp.]